MRSQTLYSLAVLLILDTCILTLHASAQDPPVASREGTAEALSHLNRRLDELEQENRAIRAENDQLLKSFANSDSESLEMCLPAAPTTTPGEGSTISMLNDTSRLNIGVTLSALSTFSTSRPFSPSIPVFLFPADSTGQDTNTFDLQARQSSISARLSGPEVFVLTPGAEILTFFLTTILPMTITACWSITLMGNSRMMRCDLPLDFRGIFSILSALPSCQ
jgi:hypothetical protein